MMPIHQHYTMMLCSTTFPPWSCLRWHPRLARPAELPRLSSTEDSQLFNTINKQHRCCTIMVFMVTR